MLFEYVDFIDMLFRCIAGPNRLIRPISTSAQAAFAYQKVCTDKDNQDRKEDEAATGAHVMQVYHARRRVPLFQFQRSLPAQLRLPGKQPCHL